VDPFLARVAAVAGNVAIIAIRAPYGNRSRKLAVARSSEDRLEVALPSPAWLSFLVPVCALVLGLLVAARLGREERMMRERFGRDCADYQARAWRLVPGVF
jgi:protein-S-isoprenylcysteine O-methyltransferase Ste14